MATMECPNSCPSLCESSIKESFLFKLSDLYPGLTEKERALASIEPTKTLLAYKLSWEAERLCLRIFVKSDTNDESDACRHFVWSFLLFRELGNEYTIRMLDAHEADPKQPVNEKAMDTANNRVALVKAHLLSKNTKLNDAFILRTFQESLKNNELIILKKSNLGGGR